MLIRSLAVVALLLTPVASPLFAARPAQAQSQQIAVAELMRATALDQVFTQFAATIAASARTEEISNDEIFLKHWEATANAVFDAKDLHRRLALALEGKFSADEQTVLGEFFHSEFGERMTLLERDAALLEPTAQVAAIA